MLDRVGLAEDPRPPVISVKRERSPSHHTQHDDPFKVTTLQFMNKRLRHYLQEKTGELLEHKIGVKFDHRRRLPNDCQGCFDGRTLEVAIGVPQKLWVPSFIHEYCHFRQFIEESPNWKRWHTCQPDLFDWLADPALKATTRQLHRTTKLYQEAEQDCDRRAVAEIKAHSLPINVEAYIRRSNVYIWFYNIVMKHRVWCAKPPYAFREIFELVPATFIPKQDYDRMPKAFEALVARLALPRRRGNRSA